MRSFNKMLLQVKAVLGIADEVKARPQYEWPKKDQTYSVYRPAEVAALLPKDVPFFQMRGGQKYAIAIRKNRKGIEIPACFIRVDKDRRPRRERKRAKRTARMLAEATI